jgi:hypothetical protein
MRREDCHRGEKKKCTGSFHGDMNAFHLIWVNAKQREPMHDVFSAGSCSRKLVSVESFGKGVMSNNRVPFIITPQPKFWTEGE